MLHQYLATALWSSTDESDTPLDKNYSLTDFSYETIKQAEKDLDEFVKRAGELLDGLDLETVAHDFWLTRNRHGAGFWDGDYSESIGDALTDLAHNFKEQWLYVGDDKKLYFG